LSDLSRFFWLYGGERIAIVKAPQTVLNELRKIQHPAMSVVAK
jgi:hypothetical protein